MENQELKFGPNDWDERSTLEEIITITMENDDDWHLFQKELEGLCQKYGYETTV